MKTISFTINDTDYDAIQQAIAHRQTWRVMPDHEGGDIAGTVLAEICRGWLEGRDERESDDG